MTAATIGAAVGEIVKLFTDYYGTANVELPNMDFDAPTDSATKWARLEIEHTDGGQSSLSDANGKKRWSRSGIGTIELMTIMGVGLGDAYADVEPIVKLFQGKRTASGVWFRDVRFAERGRRGRNPGDSRLWFQVDVYFSFTYDQLS